MNPLLIASLISASLAGSAGFGIAWRLQTATINTMELENANERINQQRTARQTLERHMQTVATAEASAAVRVTRNRADAGRAGDSGSGLRIASADTVRAASADTATCLASVAQYDQLLGAVVEAGGRMASEADGWENDALKLHSAWPK